MRLAGMFGVKSNLDEGDLAGVTIDVVTGLLAGLALIIAVWLLSSAIKAETANAAPAFIAQHIR